MRPPDDKRAGILLMAARARSGLSQTAFASLVGVAQPTLSAYESGRRQPTLPTLLGMLRRAGFAVETELVADTPRPRWEDLLDDGDRSWLRAHGVVLPPPAPAAGTDADPDRPT